MYIKGSQIKNPTNTGSLRGVKPLFHISIPLPLEKGRGIKGDGVTLIPDKIKSGSPEKSAIFLGA
jgi:hypothetical protein